MLSLTIILGEFKMRAAFLLAAIIPAASAAEQVSRTIQGDFRFWIVAVAVQVLWSIGYLASSFSQWANWPDGTRLEKFQLIQGIFTSLFAGNVAYYGGYYYVECPEVAAFISAGAAGFGGDKFLTPLMTQAFQRLERIFG